jgi:hypothetical protein
MLSRAPLLWLGALAIASCDPTLANYCAPTAPECMRADGGAADGSLANDAGAQDERAADDSTTGQDGSPPPDGSRCDATKSPHDDPCVIDESYGVFVSPRGSDANAGTRASPLMTIGRGMDLAKTTAKRLYVCAGSFGERLVVTAARDGVNVYGALDCATWKSGSANKVIVAPPRPGYALELDSLQAGVTFEDVEFDAPAGVNAGESSIAVFANKSSAVAFHRVTMVADVAADGAAGAPGGPNADGGLSADPSNWATQSLNGNTGQDAGGAPSNTCTCLDTSSSTGGRGGGAGLGGQSPGPGLPAYGVDGGGNAGTNGTPCGAGSTTGDGANAPIGGADTANASWGVLSATGWTPALGTPGSNGKPGQGGGGGGNGRLSSGAGGGGACGGCGGVGGKPGWGGGSSIALLSYQSSVTLIGCTLTVKAAGTGGAGGKGEPGQAGGSPGAPSGVGIGIGCTGGAGGAGTGGNGAQGGPGGLSLGIGYSGSAPTIDGVLVVQAASQSGVMLGTAGVGGAGGFKGAAASNSTGPAGADGVPGQNGVVIAVRQLP